MSRPWVRFFTVLGLLGFSCGIVLLAWCTYDLPDTDKVKPLELKPSITILADDGTLIARYGGMKGDVVNVKKLPQYVPAAVLAIEDRRFYDHFGIDPLGLLRAMYTNVRAHHWVQGGSTITQQLAKNLFLTPDKTLRRKVQEAVLALVIEYRFTKDEILSAYLNRVYFGAGAYGLDAAAKTYFDKRATDLSLWEGAVLAGLLKAPSKYSPASNPKLAAARAKTVIHAMQEAGYISPDMARQEIGRAKMRLATSASGELNKYFGDWIIDQIDSYVSNTDRDLIVHTTFNPQLQLLAESRQKAFFAQVKPNEKISQLGMVTMGLDGAVLSMIGGTDYGGSQFNRATQAMRQPGSSFKPFVYMAALEAGYKPDDMLDDSPITTGKYRPKNYGDKYYGAVSMTQALAFSLNTATIKMLQAVGVDRLIDVTQRLGFSEKFKPELATGLGAGETTVLEMTNAYTEIANGGYAIWPYGVTRIEDDKGRVVYSHEQPQAMRIFNPRDVTNLDGMMEQVVAQGTGQAAQLSRGHVAGKTGTSQDYRDAWFVGYTNRFVTGIWMGNDDNTPMEKVSGGKYPARLWHDYMEEAINVDVKAYAPELAREPQDNGFMSVLDRWTNSSDTDKRPNRSGGFMGQFNGSDVPVYNQ
ncbi:MAG: PBP1A family penicillin-binding protein [Micavibrio sp.]|nr:PBP1A family penicillin-binding protein [Micavibrio sp.]